MDDLLESGWMAFLDPDGWPSWIRMDGYQGSGWMAFLNPDGWPSWIRMDGFLGSDCNGLLEPYGGIRTIQQILALSLSKKIFKKQTFALQCTHL